MKARDFLLEVGVEEIPDRMIGAALEDSRRLFLEVFPGIEVETHATPRRLVLAVRQIPVKEPDRREVVTGPPVSAGENAAAGFARKMGVEVGQLKRAKTPKGEYYSYKRKVKGRRTPDVLSENLPKIILGIAWPKAMTWAGGSGPRFIRPIRWLVALYGGKVVPFEIAGVKSDRYSYGHRRLAAERRIRVADFESLREGLRRNFVLLDREERRRRILETAQPARVRPNEALLDALINLTEYPTAIAGRFDSEFLSLPEEVLVTVMQHHQKYFSVEDEAGRLAPQFVAVMNIDADPDGAVRHGHERVLRARFNDARFFWETDQKRPLAARVDDLRQVSFHAKLGSYYEKTQRNMERVKQLGGSAAAVRAAELAKCDLTTELVKEFTELEGVVGGLYARAQGEPEAVWGAIYDHHEPVPRTVEGQIVALADRLDTLEGFFRLGLMPTGSKDPFALRRAAFGVVRILVEGRHAFAIPPELREFVLERARHYFREVRGHRYDEVNAVLAAGWDSLTDAADRLEAVSQVRPTDNFEPLAASFKRIRNILRQANWDSDAAAQPDDLEPGPERELYDAAQNVSQRTRGVGYREALEGIASLRPRVDLFFDKVLVMSPDEHLRRNRLAFLSQMLREFSTIAEFSEIVIPGES